MNFLAPLIEALQRVPQKQEYDLLEKGFDDFDYTSLIYAEHLPKENVISAHFSRINMNLIFPENILTDF
jgi:DNA polymerase II large subunit